VKIVENPCFLDFLILYSNMDKDLKMKTSRNPEDVPYLIHCKSSLGFLFLKGLYNGN